MGSIRCELSEIGCRDRLIGFSRLRLIPWKYQNTSLNLFLLSRLSWKDSQSIPTTERIKNLYQTEESNIPHGVILKMFLLQTYCLTTNLMGNIVKNGCKINVGEFIALIFITNINDQSYIVLMYLWTKPKIRK